MSRIEAVLFTVIAIVIVTALSFLAFCVFMPEDPNWENDERPVDDPTHQS